MSKSDKWVIILFIASILIHIGVWTLGIVRHKVLNYLSFLNGIAGLVLISYWIRNEVWSRKQGMEGREIAFLCVEGFIVFLSIYAIVSARIFPWLRIMQYTFFALHLLVLIVFLIFMLTFKMNKLI
jgi:hypothetical protein